MADETMNARWPVVIAVVLVGLATLLVEQVGSAVAPTANLAEESTTAPPAATDDHAEEPSAGPPSALATEPRVVAPSPTESRSPTEDDVAAADLTERLAVALVERNIDLLINLLHPVVLDAYSRQECVAHLESALLGFPPVRLGSVTGTGTHEFVTPDRTVTEIPDAVFVVLVFDTDSGPEEEHSQFAWADGTLRWFTHCETAA